MQNSFKQYFKKIIKEISYFFFIFLLLILFLEFIFRVIIFIPTNVNVFKYGFKKTISFDVVDLSKFQVSIYDFDKKIKTENIKESSNKFWIFGGSTTFGNACEFKQSSSWPKQTYKIDNKFKYRNFAFHGANSDQQLILLLKEINKNNARIPDLDDSNLPKITSEHIKALSESYNQMLKTVNNESREPTVEIKLDNDRRRTTVLPQRKYSKGVTDELRDIVSPKYDLNFLNDDTNISNEYKEVLREELERTTLERSQSIDDITQTSVPELSNHKESLVETVQGSFIELPAASTGTKYFMTQYRADQAKETSLSVTLSMSPVNTGSSHFTCNAPSGSTGGSSSDGQGGTVNTSYTMSGLLGPGCQPWSASGSIRMFHDLSSAAIQAANAGAAYGNPFNIT